MGYGKGIIIVLDDKGLSKVYYSVFRSEESLLQPELSPQ
jgi:hypothetical protein